MLNKRSLEKLKDQWWNRHIWKPDCRAYEEGEGIGVSNIGGVFVVIIGGILISAGILLFEYWFYRTHPRLRGAPIPIMRPKPLRHQFFSRAVIPNFSQMKRSFLAATRPADLKISTSTKPPPPPTDKKHKGRKGANKF